MKSIGDDAKRLVKRAKKRGEDRATFGGCYRATLFARPWRLIVVPMPAQPPGSAQSIDPNGNAWELGAAITAALIAQAIGPGRFEASAPPDLPPAAGEPRLAFMYELRQLPS